MTNRVSRKTVRAAFLGGASTLALCFAAPGFAQDAPAGASPAADSDVVVITGVRGSLQRSMNIKKNATGVVDAISAEDIGKYPDTNLAESVQRIPGVSIDRVNGEGSQVTVRGFGPGFNLVTLNGRTMPTANVATIGGDQNSDGASGTGRSFDFGNIASDGISGFEVYKTGRAAVTSGGIGATLNIKTLRPLSGRAGSNGSLTAKALTQPVWHGKEITPEISGAYSWTNDDKTFGVSLFGAISERNGTTRSTTVNDWNIERGSGFMNTGNGRINANTDVTGVPDADELVSFANDSRYHLSENESKRTNLQGTVQWRPMDTLTLTVDALFIENEQTEQRMDQTNWFSRPFGEVIFDGNSPVNTAVYLSENQTGSTKDIGYEQQQRATKDSLTSIGFNAAWQASDRLTVNFDVHSSKGESLPNNPNGTSSTRVGIGAPVVDSHSVDFRSGIPVQRWTFGNDALGNNNGRLDIGDLGSTMGLTTTSSQTHEVDEVRLNAVYDFNGESRLDVGVSYRTGEMNQARSTTEDTLGDWNVSDPGDIEQFAPGLIEQFCLSCMFEDFEVGDAQIAFQGNAVDLLAKMAPAYGITSLRQNSSVANTVKEDVWAAYAELSLKGDFLGMPANVNAGLRYEKTQVTSTAAQGVPSALLWISDNDFRVELGTGGQNIQFEGEYDNWLPNLDISVNVRDDLIARASFSKTIARPSFGSLFAATTIGNPSRPTAFGVNPTANTGNPGLLPLESSNIDFSVEWYFDSNSYVSAGFYNKDVANFEGTGQTVESLFDLRDPSSGAAGTRSGEARAALTTIGADIDDFNLFTMTALIDQFGLATATSQFTAAYTNPDPQVFADFIVATYNAYDLAGNAEDPLYQFRLSRPINNRTANIHGFEFAGQHFFGDSGFGIAGSYTTVEGDVGIDVGADPSVNQFALLGLSNTYNVTLIYDKNALSGRLSYNWRDEYLREVNRQSGRSPAFVAPFGQLDVSVNYQLTPSVLLTFEGLNLTKESLRVYGRDESNLWFAQELDSRYQVGVRYKF